MADAGRHRFTVEEYERMAEAGILADDDRVELIAGEIVEKPVIGPRHAEGVSRCTMAFVLRLAGRATVRPQSPVRLPGVDSEPEPDVAVIRPRSDGYGRGHPGPDDVLLVVEVADTSRRSDRRRKIPLYAAEGIVEVWLMDVDADRIEIHRDPGPHGYASVTLHGRGDSVACLAFPHVDLEVDELLPPR